MWYRRSFEVPANGKTNRLSFILAVDHDATLFVNGKKAGSHAGGYDSLALTLRPILKKGKIPLLLPHMILMMAKHHQAKTARGAIILFHRAYGKPFGWSR
jgi:hypothetical protein